MQKMRKMMLSPVHWNAPSYWHCDNHGSSSILSEPVQRHLGKGAVPSYRTLTPSANPITTVTVALMLAESMQENCVVLSDQQGRIEDTQITEDWTVTSQKHFTNTHSNTHIMREKPAAYFVGSPAKAVNGAGQVTVVGVVPVELRDREALRLHTLRGQPHIAADIHGNTNSNKSDHDERRNVGPA
jgi:hypothetical protein